jgi:hypothetical protein
MRATRLHDYKITRDLIYCNWEILTNLGGEHQDRLLKVNTGAVGPELITTKMRAKDYKITRLQ